MLDFYLRRPFEATRRRTPTIRRRPATLPRYRPNSSKRTRTVSGSSRSLPKGGVVPPRVGRLVAGVNVTRDFFRFFFRKRYGRLRQTAIHTNTVSSFFSSFSRSAHFPLPCVVDSTYSIELTRVCDVPNRARSVYIVRTLPGDVPCVTHVPLSQLKP